KELLSWLLEHNILIIYLTGRDLPNMSEGTIKSLKKHGFPVDDSTRFMFKPNFDEPDLDFKIMAMKEINSIGKVIFAFENEPGNANIIKESCPDADVFLINTITSPNPAELASDIIRFDQFPE
ncbi:MAG: HAD family hydrolase, partial [Spirochaetales bacterium]|nr:HAD family hydrolase [Spirochaetales bacterium]